MNSGQKPAIDGLEGRKSVEIILAIYESAWTGRKGLAATEAGPAAACLGS